MDSIKGKKFLIINDDPKLSAQMERWLADEGGIITKTLTGEEGVGLVKRNYYDLVLLDYNLKKEANGTKYANDFIPSITRENPYCPIVVTSATDEKIPDLSSRVSRTLFVNRQFWNEFIPTLADILKNKLI